MDEKVEELQEGQIEPQEELEIVPEENLHGNVMEQESLPEDAGKLELAPILIISGDGGVGKTKLTASGGTYHGFLFDMENGGQAVYHKPCIRSYNPADPQLAIKFAADLVRFSKLPRVNDGRQVKLADGTLIDYIVLDTADTLQGNLIENYQAQKKVGWGNDKKAASAANGLFAGNYNPIAMEQADWGAVKGLFKPILSSLIALRMPVIIVTHSSGAEAQFGAWNSQKRALDVKKTGSMKLGISGGIGDILFNLSRGCIYVIYDPISNKREILTRPQVYRNKLVQAKDTFGIFPNAVVKWEKPDMKFVQAWLDRFVWGNEKQTL